MKSIEYPINKNSEKVLIVAAAIKEAKKMYEIAEQLNQRAAVIARADNAQLEINAMSVTYNDVMRARQALEVLNTFSITLNK